MNRILALEFVRVTEAAALAAAQHIGKGNEKAADQAAVDAMRQAFDKTNIRGRVVIGEGERDQAPMLYIGEQVGRWHENDPPVDVALDPLEGTSICATGGVGALSVLAVSSPACFLNAPDVYMNKVACGPRARGAIDLQAPVQTNVVRVAEALGKKKSDLRVVILNRPRHEKLIQQVRMAGASVVLIGDGDVSAAIATCQNKAPIDLLLGIGGAPEGVLAAAAIKCLGGDFQAELVFTNDEQKQRARHMGLKDLTRIYKRDDLACGEDVFFCATGVTDGPFLKGVQVKSRNKVCTWSVLMRSRTGTLRYIKAQHDLSKKPM